MCHLNSFYAQIPRICFLYHTFLHTKSLITSKVSRFHLLGIFVFRGFQNLSNSSNKSVKNKEYHENGAKIEVKIGELLKRGETGPIMPGRAWPGCNLSRARLVRPHEAQAHVRPALVVVF